MADDRNDLVQQSQVSVAFMHSKGGWDRTEEDRARVRYDDVDLADNDFLPSTTIVALHPEDKSNEVVLTMVFIKGGGGNRSGTNSLSLYWLLFHLEEVWQL